MSYIQDTLGWGLGFAIPSLSMMMSILMFLIGSRFYMHKQQDKNAEGNFLELTIRAVKVGMSKLIHGGGGSSRNLELE